MSRIATIFESLRAQKRGALMPFITAGYPTLQATCEVIPALERAGATVIEIGFPFSDPIADGPVIAESMHAALKAGLTPWSIFEAIKHVRATTEVALMAMASDSIVARIGTETFIAAAADAGFDGLIVPDIDLDAAEPLAGLARLHGLTLSLLIAPTTSAQRCERIAKLCTGFIYLLARAGTTGAATHLDMPALQERVKLIRRHSQLPIAVGFGISTAEQVRQVYAVADAVIVGSALVARMAKPSTAIEQARMFMESLAIDQAS